MSVNRSTARHLPPPAPGRGILVQIAVMSRIRTTVTLDEDVFRAVKIRAARTGKRDSQVIEESLRRDLELVGQNPAFTPAQFLAAQFLAAQER